MKKLLIAVVLSFGFAAFADAPKKDAPAAKDAAKTEDKVARPGEGNDPVRVDAAKADAKKAPKKDAKAPAKDAPKTK